MEDRSGQILIAGAGIAGLTAALAFAQRGFPVRLFERAPVLEEIGAGLQLSPNATRILTRLGVASTLAPAAVRPESIAIRDARSQRLLAFVPLGPDAEARWGAPYLVVHRADLQNALLAHAGQHTDIELTTGAKVLRASSDRHGAVAVVERDGQLEDVRGRLVIGADGVWSTLRGFGGRKGASRHSGYTAWRTTIPTEAAALPSMPADRVTTFLHHRFHLVAYPVRGGGAMNLVAVTRGLRGADDWSNASDAGALLEVMRGAAEPLIAFASEAAWTTWPIHTVDHDQPWTDGARLALVGDAAHAMTPYAAQGAAMAIEDAAMLAALVAKTPEDPETALRRYETLRRPRVKRVARRGAFNHFAWHAAGPVAMARNLVLSLRPPQRLAADLDWLYGWDPETEIPAV